MSEQSGVEKEGSAAPPGQQRMGEKEGLNGGVSSALELSFHFSFALRPETTATCHLSLRQLFLCDL
jgi:hypothetical protein